MSLQSKLNPSAREFVTLAEKEAIRRRIRERAVLRQNNRNNSSNFDPLDPHHRDNCSSNFQSLASHLDRLMNTPGTPPDRAEVLNRIHNCMESRENSADERIKADLSVDISHQIVLKLLDNLYNYVNNKIRDGSSASFEFFDNPLRFVVRSEGTGMVIFVGREKPLREVKERRPGGRKSTRKNRKSKRKTYRILPRVEGS
jgi:hypothetical protein